MIDLSEFFEGVGTTVLSRVDAEKLDKHSAKKVSNQHEVSDNATGKLFRQVLGEGTRAKKTGNPFPTRYI